MAGKIDVNVNQNNNQVILTQNTTNVVEVKTLGPQGQRGADGISPQGTISSSAQIANDISGSFTEISGSLSSRVYTLESGQFTNITASGTISSSANIFGLTGSFGKLIGDGSSLINLPSSGGGSGIFAVTGSSQNTTNDLQVTGSLTVSGVIRGSTFSGSFSGDGSGIANVTSTVPQGTVSSSAQIAIDISGSFTAPSASFSTRVTTLETSGGGSGIFAVTGSSQNTTNNLQITGSLTVSSSITASGNISSSGFVQGNIVKAPEFQIASGSQGVGHHLLAIFDNGAIRLGYENNTPISLGKNGLNSIELLGIVTASGDISSSASIIGLSGSFGILKVEGSGSNILEVVGSAGDLFTVSDSKTGSLFTVTDISSIPQFDIHSNGDVLIGSTPTSLYTTTQILSTSTTLTQSLFSINTSSYDGAFFDYTCISASNMRAGSITSVWNSGGSGVVFNETTTADIGNTSTFNILVNISQSKAHLQVHTSGGWKVKTIIRII
tara:strand:- start:15273 stop:16760 length:1488 start_codon:yes stop_codon:yes gene_type:complete